MYKHEGTAKRSRSSQDIFHAARHAKSAENSRTSKMIAKLTEAAGYSNPDELAKAVLNSNKIEVKWQIKIGTSSNYLLN